MRASWLAGMGEPKTLLRFMVVGASGVVLGTALLWFFTSVLGIFYLLSATIAALLAVFSDFIFNNYWTFAHRGGRGARAVSWQMGKFATSKLAGLVLSLAVLAFFTQVVGFHYLFSNIFAVGASFLVNYSLSWRWVWTQSKGSSGASFPLNSGSAI